VTARTLSGGAATNYSGDYARNVSLTARDMADTSDNPGPGSLSPAIVLNSGFSGGVASATPSYAFTNQRTAQTAVRVRASESEVTSLRSPASLTVEGAASIMSGRARLANAYGSELLDLPILFRTESWNGNGWVLNTLDSCTGDTTADANNAVSVALASPPAALPTCIHDTDSPGLSGAGCAAAATAERRFREGAMPTVGFAGDFNLWLQAPGAGNFGTTVLKATVPAWLGVVPPAMATFGRYKTPLIYRREVFQ
jgi:MSHA biogenesis protein MshQ